MSNFRPSLDPNLGKNRIPTQAELDGIRRIHQQNCGLADHLEKELASAREAESRVQARRTNLLIELEGIDSELIASHRFISVLEQQQLALHTENDNLTGLLHPIRRCPDDILLLIFGWAIERASGKRLQVATIISAVCQSWRELAIHSGAFWTQITISMNDAINSIDTFMQRTLERLQSVPADVHLKDVGGSTGKQDAIIRSILPTCGIHRLKAINELKIYFNNRQAIQLLLDPIFSYSGPLKHLFIDTPNSAWGFRGSFDLAQALDSFPTTREFTIACDHSVTLTNPQPRPNIRSLSLLRVDLDADTLIFSSFPGLVDMNLNGVRFATNAPRKDIILPNLQELVVHNCHNMPWIKLNFPKLQSVTSRIEQNDCIGFICRHTTIQTLLVNLKEEQIKEVALVLRELRVISVDALHKGLYDWKSIGLDSPPFPKLRVLAIADIDTQRTISGDDLNDFIQVRCSPQPETQCGEEEEDRAFEILIFAPLEKIRGYPWRKGILSIRQTQHEFNDGSSSLTLTWPKRM